MPKTEIDRNWKALPVESKRYWAKQGRNQVPIAQRPSSESVGVLKRIMKSGLESNQPQGEASPLGWMENAM